MSNKVPLVQLSNGVFIPAIGLGTYARKAEQEQYRKAVEDGIDVGYRHIDTASSYKNEAAVGQGIANKIKEGVVTRDDLFVTTKLWNDCHAPEDVVPALKESLAKLKLDYVDLYLIHWPVSVNKNGDDAKIDYVETWRAMEQAVELGLTKSIGVSNFSKEQLIRLLQAAKIQPVVNQIEINPTFAQHKLVEFCKQQGVVPVAYTPLGLLSEARPEFAGKDGVKTDPALGQVAQRHNKTRPQVALRYLIQRGIVVIPKTFTRSRMEENLDIFEWALSEQEMSTVANYDLGHRCVPATTFAHLHNYPF